MNSGKTSTKESKKMKSAFNDLETIRNYLKTNRKKFVVVSFDFLASGDKTFDLFLCWGKSKFNSENVSLGAVAVYNHFFDSTLPQNYLSKYFDCVITNGDNRTFGIVFGRANKVLKALNNKIKILAQK